MNTNLLHNILNVIMALAAIALIPDVQSLFPPETAVGLTSGAAAAKLIVNAIRDGISGMVKEQPPVRE